MSLEKKYEHDLQEYKNQYSNGYDYNRIFEELVYTYSKLSIDYDILVPYGVKYILARYSEKNKSMSWECHWQRTFINGWWLTKDSFLKKEKEYLVFGCGEKELIYVGENLVKRVY